LSSGSTGFFYDAGGPSGNYVDDMNTVTTIMPDNNNDKLSVSFNYFITYSDDDYLKIHDGNSITSPMIGSFSGTINPGTITASSENVSGALTFKFISNGSANRGGWAAILTSLEGTTSVEENEKGILSEYILGQNFPNPIINQTEIKFALPVTSQVTINIYDNLGRKVTTLFNEEKPAGDYSVNFDASGLESGIYYYRIQAGNVVQTRKMIVK
jgi:hypothetical protein